MRQGWFGCDRCWIGYVVQLRREMRPGHGEIFIECKLCGKREVRGGWGTITCTEYLDFTPTTIITEVESRGNGGSGGKA
jgi:hypothetical protein